MRKNMRVAVMSVPLLLTTADEDKHDEHEDEEDDEHSSVATFQHGNLLARFR